MPPSARSVSACRTRFLARGARAAVAMALCLAGTATLHGGTAQAIPFGRRIALRAEADTAFSVSTPNSDVYPVGFLASFRMGLGIVEPISLQLAVTEGVFPSTTARASLNTFYHAGIRIEPRTIAPEGRIFFEATGGLDITGYYRRFGFDLAIGWELAVSRYIQMGPVVRYSHIVQVTDPLAPQDAQFLGAGLTFALRPFPPPRLRQGNLLAIDPLNAPDSDFDGVPDYLDQCPGAVEDHDGFQDDDGCPDLDDDGDGIPDAEDRCPRAPETVNGYEDDDGCPDEVPETTAPVEFRGDQLRLQQRVYFGVERVRVPPSVMPILTQLARFLNQHPEVQRLRIEGHADDRGTRRHGFDLSLRRAMNIKAFLVEQGVEATRLEAVGYGDLRPLGTFHDEVTRAGNRRIEFILAEGPAGVAPAPPAGVLTEAASSSQSPTSAPVEVPGPRAAGVPLPIPAPRPGHH